MVKCTINEQQEQCPICYSQPNEWTKPKRCRHKYCYECLSNWIQKGKKSCPMCRKNFNSIIYLRKKRIIKPNGNISEKESAQEIKIDQIKNRASTRLLTTPMVLPRNLIQNQLFLSHSFTLMVPTNLLWSPLIFPFLPARFNSVA